MRAVELILNMIFIYGMKLLHSEVPKKFIIFAKTYQQKLH